VSNPSVATCIKNFLASLTLTYTEPFQRTDISMKPLGPTNYTGSYTSSKNMIVVIGAWVS
jgi:hypothetical protein